MACKKQNSPRWGDRRPLQFKEKPNSVYLKDFDALVDSTNAADLGDAQAQERLNNAAPDLLEVCKENSTILRMLLDLIYSTHSHDSIYRAALESAIAMTDAAIARAGGGT